MTPTLGELGYNLVGQQDQFGDALLVALTAWQRPYRYLEIGLGHGKTFLAVKRFLAECKVEYQATGVDRPQWINHSNIHESELRIIGSEAFCESLTLDDRFSFVFIDACHGEPCVRREFLAIEHHVLPEGIIAFHDYEEQVQGRHMQPHCNAPIGVRAALKSVGLLDGTRPGWRTFAATTGPDKNGIFYAQRIRDTGQDVAPTLTEVLPKEPQA